MPTTNTLEATVDLAISRIPDSEARAFAFNKCSFRSFAPDYAACVLPPGGDCWTIILNLELSAERLQEAIVQAVARAFSESDQQALELCRQWGFEGSENVSGS